MKVSFGLLQLVFGNYASIAIMLSASPFIMWWPFFELVKRINFALCFFLCRCIRFWHRHGKVSAGSFDVFVAGTFESSSLLTCIDIFFGFCFSLSISDSANLSI